MECKPRDSRQLRCAAPDLINTSLVCGNMLPNELHRALASAAAHAEQVASAVQIDESMHFVKARQKIRAASREDGVSEKIDKLVADLRVRYYYENLPEHYSQSMVTPKYANTRSIGLAIAIVPVSLPAKSKPTGLALASSVTSSEPESPGNMNALVVSTII